MNRDRAELTLRCLRAVAATRWPREQIEVVVVDNGSADGSAERIERAFPDVRIVRSKENLGFAGANNLALRDLVGVEYAALVNNDAFVEPTWLAPLVAALETDPSVGAACPKVLFAPRFKEIMLEAPPSRRRGDRRLLGVRVKGIRVDGEDRWREVQFVRGWHGWERDTDGMSQWSGPTAMLRVPSKAGDTRVRFRIDADRPKSVRLSRDGLKETFHVGPEERWVEVRAPGGTVDVVNSAGAVAIRGGYGGDRGFLETDEGQYDDGAEVFGWSGCAVLLARRYVEDVGLFDPRLFLYYEDFDLSWRGRARGWRYVYVPESVVRHIHAASTVEGSPLFGHYDERNRLLVLVKNAPASYAALAFARYVAGTAWYGGRDIIGPLLRREQPRPARVVGRLRVLASLLRELPHAIEQRRALRMTGLLARAELERWLVDHPAVDRWRSPAGAKGGDLLV